MKAEVHMPSVVRGITLQCKVTGAKRTRMRLWAGAQVMKLAALIMGCDIAIEMNDER